ncbi:MAG: hypothetical protein WAK35_18370, partial [Xanthobacteraceae bacterium]
FLALGKAQIELQTERLRKFENGVLRPQALAVLADRRCKDRIRWRQSRVGQLVIQPALANVQGADRTNAESILKASLAEGITRAMLIAAAIALGGAAAGALIPRRTKGGSGGPQSP